MTPAVRFMRSLLVHPNGLSRALGRLARTIYFWHHNYNFDFASNGEFALLEKLKPFAMTTVFDVGAYKGYWSLEALAILSPRQLYAFEPVPRSFTRLEKNLAGHANVNLFNLAVSNAQGEMTIAFNREKPTRSGFHARTRQYKGLEQVKVAVVDIVRFCKEHDVGMIDLIKIDVEGHEHQVITGLEPLLATAQVRAIQFEFSPLGTVYDVGLWQIYETLSAHGYVAGKIFPDGVAFGAAAGPEDEMPGPNYFAARRDDLALLRATAAPRRMTPDWFDALQDQNPKSGR